LNQGDFEQPLLLEAPTNGEPPPRGGAIKAGAPRWLPFSKQFSPNQIESLEDFLRIIDGGGTDKSKIEKAILKRFRPNADPDDPQLRTMAYNSVLSAQHYGLVTARLELSDAGRLIRDTSNESNRRELLAKHILQRLHGIELVHGLDSLRRAGVSLRKDHVANHFATKGLWSNPDGTDINALVAWLRIAGVFTGKSGFNVDEARFAELADITVDEVSQVGRVDPAGAAILEELALIPGRSATSGEMQRRLKVRPGLNINIPNFVTAHLRPLEKAGLIKIEKTTEGRGGEAMRIAATPLFGRKVVKALLKRVTQSGLSVTDPELQIPVAELVKRMASTDKDVKGRGLELFALRLLLRLGLSDIRWRPRPQSAEEIDGSAVGYVPVHMRWQVQCKNTKTLNVDDAAKEVGLAVRNRSTIIVLVTTGEFSHAAEDFVTEVVRHSPYTVLRLDRKDVERLAKKEEALADILQREAERAHALRNA
jgi:Restriction endonuclease